MLIILSLTHREGVKICLIISNLQTVKELSQCGRGSMGCGVGQNWIQISMLALTQHVILAKLHKSSELTFFLLAKWW